MSQGSDSISNQAFVFKPSKNTPKKSSESEISLKQEIKAIYKKETPRSAHESQISQADVNAKNQAEQTPRQNQDGELLLGKEDS